MAEKKRFWYFRDFGVLDLDFYCFKVKNVMGQKWAAVEYSDLNLE